MDALVTGGTSGIGRAIALALARAGYSVTVVGRQKSELDALQREHGIGGLALDVTQRLEVEQALRDLEPDVLVNNAGVMPPLTHFCDTDFGEMERAIAVNLTSVMQITRLIAPAMRRRSRGHIFFTGSTAGHAPFVNLATYCASTWHPTACG